MTTITRQLWFTGPGQLEIREQEVSAPDAGELLIEVICSAISAGTEMLVYRGQLPAEIALDATIDNLKGEGYPLQYGYACVGKVIQIGNDVENSWLGKNVFAFQPHATHFISRPQNLIPVPADVAPEDAVFLANMETAVNLVHDGKPLVGERIVVLGQGIVGLLLTSVLSKLPLAELLVADHWPLRRDQAAQYGATVFNPLDEDDCIAQKKKLAETDGADLIYELTGVPDALNLAVDLSGYHSRIVIGSWYGTKSAPVYLGGAAHRNRLQFTTSQVSSIAPDLSGRWNKSRRFELAWEMIRKVKPSRLISERVQLQQAPDIYQRLDQQPGSLVQVLFVY